MKTKSHKSKIFLLILRSIILILLSFYALLNVYGYRFDPMLRQVTKTGVIEIRAFPSDINIFLDGVFQHHKSPYEIRDVDIGVHEVTLQAPAFQAVHKIVRVEDLYVVRFGHLFLLPDQMERYMRIMMQGIDQRFVAGENIFFY